MPKTHEFEAEIFSAGKWNGDNYTELDIEDIVENFNSLKGKVKPPLKLGHTGDKKWTEGGQPALGWVKSLKRVGDKLVATLSEVPDIVYQAITSGRYRRVSSEIYWNFKATTGKTFNYVLKAVALLGADIPAVDNLEDLTAYLERQKEIGTPLGKTASYEIEWADDFMIKTHDAEPVKKTEPQKKTPVSKEKKMAEADIKKFEDRIAMLESKLTGADEARKTAESKLKEFEKQQADERRSDRFAELKAFCEENVRAGKMTPADGKKLMEENTLHYTDERGISIPLEVFKQYVKSTEKVIEFQEKGQEKTQEDERTYASASDELDVRSKEYALKHDVDYEAASDAILAADKDLADRFKYGQ